jgi:hypothetical protein
MKDMVKFLLCFDDGEAADARLVIGLYEAGSSTMDLLANLEKYNNLG